MRVVRYKPEDVRGATWPCRPAIPCSLRFLAAVARSFSPSRVAAPHRVALSFFIFLPQEDESAVEEARQETGFNPLPQEERPADGHKGEAATADCVSRAPRVPRVPVSFLPPPFFFVSTGTLSTCKYVYYGRHSEGNRFIRNNDL